jgi:hypothetical protein
MCCHCCCPSKYINQRLDLIVAGQENIVTALDSLKAADQALKDEVAAFLADIQGRLSGNPSEADLQAIADDINTEVASLKAADPGPAEQPPSA